MRRRTSGAGGEFREQAAKSRRRGSEDPAAIGRAIVETVAWMAMHRFKEPKPMQIDEAAARSACIAMACGGVLRTSATSGRVDHRPRKLCVA